MEKLKKYLGELFSKSDLTKYNYIIAKNKLANYLHKKYGKKIFKELVNIEIESKFELTHNQSNNLIKRIKKFFKSGQIEGFITPRHFPFIISTSSYNLYFNYKGKTVKILSGYRKKRSNIKSKLRLANNKFKLNNISIRDEFKARNKVFIDKVINKGVLINGLFRKREAIWVDKIESGRTYHITLDTCYSKGNKLCELEVEYTGNYKNKKANQKDKAEIVNDVAFLTNTLKNNYLFLKESRLTKEDWSRMIKN